MQGFFNCIYYYQVAFCVVKELLQYETNGYIFYLYLFRKIEIIAKKSESESYIYIYISLPKITGHTVPTYWS